MNSINSLESLFEQSLDFMLKNPNNDISFLIPLIEKYTGNDWKNYVLNCENSYIRCVVKQHELLDIYIISWSPNCESQIHDHPDNGCILKILDGELQEDEYINENNCISFSKTNILKEGLIGFKSKNKILHKIINKENKVTVSLHLYSKGGYKSVSYYL